MSSSRLVPDAPLAFIQERVRRQRILDLPCEHAPQRSTCLSSNDPGCYG